MRLPSLTLRGKLVLGAISLALGALAGALPVDLARTRRLVEQTQRALQEQAMRRLVEVAVNAAEQNNDLGVIRHMKVTAGSPAVLYLAVTDSENRVRLHTDLLRGDRSILGRAWRVVPEEDRQSVRATDVKVAGLDVREWSGPVPLKGRWHGMAYLGYDQIKLRGELDAELRKSWLAFLSAALPVAAVAFLLAHLLAGQVKRRLGDLGAAAKALGDGTPDGPLPAPPDELGNLAGAFNRMSEQLRLAQESREESFASITHDLKAPLANILAITQLLREQAKARLVPEDAACLSSIVSITQRMSIMIQEILDIARMKAGQLVMRKSPTAVADVAKEALRVIEPTAQDLGVRITLDVPPGVPPMLVDPLLIVRVLVNLLANALRFTPQGGHVGVTAALREQRVEVLVSDSGTGISRERLATLFTRFQQVPESMGAARQAVGTGLGLAVCKAIVTAHGGDIWVQSSDGGGTVIVFALPIR